MPDTMGEAGEDPTSNVELLPVIILGPGAIAPIPQRAAGMTQTADVLDGIYAFLSAWEADWEQTAGENGSMKSCVAHYADSFTPGGLDRDGRQQG